MTRGNADSPHSDEFLTVKEVAHRLRMSRDAVERRIRSGELAAINVGTGTRTRIRIPAAALAAYIARADITR